MVAHPLLLAVGSGPGYPTGLDGAAIAKGAAKSQVAIQHRKLPSRAHAEAMKRLWAERLDALARQLAAASGSPGKRRG